MRKHKTAKRILILIFIWSIPLVALLLPEENVPSEGQATYALAWDWGDATATDDGWRVTTNLGYEVEVAQAYSIAYEAQLTACEHSHGWFDWINLGVGIVYAGHGDDSNESTLSSALVEDIANPQTQTWGTVTLVEPTYCEAFYLVARGADDTANLPDDVDMFGASIYIQGTYTVSDSNEVIDFILQTRHANGVSDDFVQDNTPVHLSLSNEDIEIVITRSLDSLLDDVDFATMDTEDASFEVLRNIVAGTRFEVVSGEVHEN